MSVDSAVFVCGSSNLLRILINEQLVFRYSGSSGQSFVPWRHWALVPPLLEVYRHRASLFFRKQVWGCPRSCLAALVSISCAAALARGRFIHINMLFSKFFLFARFVTELQFR